MLYPRDCQYLSVCISALLFTYFRLQKSLYRRWQKQMFGDIADTHCVGFTLLAQSICPTLLTQLYTHIPTQMQLCVPLLSYLHFHINICLFLHKCICPLFRFAYCLPFARFLPAQLTLSHICLICSSSMVHICSAKHFHIRSHASKWIIAVSYCFFSPSLLLLSSCSFFTIHFLFHFHRVSRNRFRSMLCHAVFYFCAIVVVCSKCTNKMALVFVVIHCKCTNGISKFACQASAIHNVVSYFSLSNYLPKFLIFCTSPCRSPLFLSFISSSGFNYVSIYRVQSLVGANTQQLPPWLQLLASTRAFELKAYES